MMRTSILVWMLAALVVLGLLSGCSKEQADPTQNTTTTPTTTAPKDPAKDPIAVEYDHCGLHFKLDSTYTVGLKENDKKTFTFSSGQISGTATFGKLSELGNGATSSQQYANLLMERIKDQSPWVGSSTGFGYYVISTKDDVRMAECLYIHGENAWLVKAQGSTTLNVEELVKIVGRCGLNADEIPVE